MPSTQELIERIKAHLICTAEYIADEWGENSPRAVEGRELAALLGSQELAPPHSDSDKMTQGEAESEIALVLKQFEIDNGCLVDSIYINEVDVTTISDDRPRLIRRVVIAAKRTPGSNWGTK